MVDLGYPWGDVDVPDGYMAIEIAAACHSDDHFSHSGCSNPYWEEEVRRIGAIVLDGPIYDSYSGWIALIAVKGGES